MPRIDVNDIPKEKPKSRDFGYAKNFAKRYGTGRELGKGGFGSVRAVKDSQTGKEFACKTIPKELKLPGLSAARQAQHQDNIQKEVSMLKTLRGTLNVVHFRKAYEDESNVYIIMELCSGGELLHRVGRKHYSEKTVASFMRAVMRTLAQCHAHRIMHRDVKPGNFLLLNDEDRSPLKAIDFGMAVFFDPKELPCTDLGLEGTAWYMAPEVLNSKQMPASDVWSAGVMAYQLLSGYLPFNDHRNPDSPALSVIWKSILSDKPSFRQSAWQQISPEGKAFVQKLLNKDPDERISARDALKDPWLAGGSTADRQSGPPIQRTVVQRLQLFGQSGVVRRSILELIAAELLKMMPQQNTPAATPDPSIHPDVPAFGLVDRRFSENGDASDETASERLSPSPSSSFLSSRSGHNLLAEFRRRNTPPTAEMQRLASIKARESMRGASTGDLTTAVMNGITSRSSTPDPQAHPLSHSTHGNIEYSRQEEAGSVPQSLPDGTPSRHQDGPSYWRMMRAAANALWHKTRGREGSQHGSLGSWRRTPVSRDPVHEEEGEDANYDHCCWRDEDERSEQRKVARLALESSHHGHPHNSQAFDVPPGRVPPAFDPVANGAESYCGDEPEVDPPTLEEWSRAASTPRSGATAIPDGRRSLADDDFGARLSMDWPALRNIAEAEEGVGESGRRGQGAYAEWLRAQGQNPLSRSNSRELGSSGRLSRDGSGTPRLPPLQRQSSSGQENMPANVLSGQARPSHDGSDSPMSSGGASPKTPGGSLRPPRSRPVAVPGASNGVTSPHRANSSEAERETTLAIESEGQGGAPIAVFTNAIGEEKVVDLTELRDVMRALNFTREAEGVTVHELAQGLQALGYKLAPSEVAALAEQVHPGAKQNGTVDKSAFLASQLDWNTFMSDHREQWLECCKRAFEGLERDSAGRVTSVSLLEGLRSRLPAAEIEYAVEDALIEAGYADAEEVDFEGFLKLLKVGGNDSAHNLDQYDSRMRGDPGHSDHGANNFTPGLQPVAEET